MRKLIFTIITFASLTIAFAQPYILKNGIYDDFQKEERTINDSTGAGLFSWSTNENKISFESYSNGANITINQEESGYEVLGFVFGNNLETMESITLDLSSQALISMEVTNSYDSTLKFYVHLHDIEGNVIDTKSDALNDNSFNFWEYESSFIIESGNTETINLDLTNGVSTDFNIQDYTSNGDLSKISGISFTIVNNNLTPSDYQPYAINNAKVTIHNLKIEGGELKQEIGCMDSTASNYNSDAVIDGTCTYDIIGCTDPIALNYDASANTTGNCTYPDSLSNRYITENSIFEDFKVTGRTFNDSTGEGMYPWSSRENSLRFENFNNGSNLLISQDEGDYEVLGFVFGSNPETDAPITLDLSEQALISMQVTNSYDSTLKVYVNLMDVDGNIIDRTQEALNEDDLNNFWQYESAFVIEPGQTETITLDLTDGVGLDFFNQIYTTDGDLSKINGISFTVVNNNLNPFDYLTYAINNAKVTIHSLKIEGGELKQEIGCKDSTASNYNPDAVLEGTCTYDIIGCTDPLALNYDASANTTGNCLYPDSLSYRYITENSVFEDFKISERVFNSSTGEGMYPWSSRENSLRFENFNNGSNLLISQNEGDYEVLGFVFGSNPETDAPITLDLSEQALISLQVTNSYDSTLKIYANLMDVDGNVIDTKHEALNDDFNNFWQYESAVVIEPGQTETITLDLTDGVGVDFLNQTYTTNGDLSKINGIGFTVVNNNLNSDFQPYEINNAKVTIHSLKIEGGEITQEIGCMDSTASNYNPDAVINGTCTYDIIGCTDTNAINYNPNANSSGTCLYPEDIELFGCMDSQADNYNSFATLENGSCSYSTLPDSIYGCIDQSALNYNEYANIDNGSCIFNQDTVNNIPEDIITGINKVDSVYVSDIETCEINFNKVIDSVTVPKVEVINSDEISAIIRIHQQGEYYEVETILSLLDVENDILLHVDLICDQSKLKVSSNNSGKVTVVTVIRAVDSQIISSNNNLQESEISFVPNPAHSTIQIFSNNTDISKITIYDSRGTIVKEVNLENELSLDISHLQTGLYFTSILTAEGHVKNVSFIKE